LDDRSVQSLSAASYEAARLLFAEAQNAGAEINVTPSGELEISIRTGLNAAHREAVGRSVEALATGPSMEAPKEARSRRYASTVRGERRAARRSRKLSTSGSWRSLIAAGPDSAARGALLRGGVYERGCAWS